MSLWTPELLAVRSQLIVLLQNALRRDSYVGLTQYDQQRELVLAAVTKLREDRDNMHFQGALRDFVARLFETMKEKPSSIGGA
ncbi:MAG TPA: hypothetical protein VFB68_16345 [Xanthobacteraceae bacterium]|nr:hypothetical protein [Xanthobacteraceae bacterium]